VSSDQNAGDGTPSLRRPDGLDPLLIDLTRLSLVGLLAGADWAEFPAVRDALEMSDSALSKQAATLEREGYVEIRKGYIGKRPRTWLQLTTEGRLRLSKHVDALQRLAAPQISHRPARPAATDPAPTSRENDDGPARQPQDARRAPSP
jgi:hypothetical protein